MALKYTNQERTAATFNGTSFSLAAPDEWESIGNGPTRDAVKAWIAAGNEPQLADQPSEAQILAAFTDAIQQRLDAFARTRNYDGILSACTYATSTNPKFATEGQRCVELRDATWATAYEILAEVQAGRPMPASIADIEPELPVLAWPN